MAINEGAALDLNPLPTTAGILELADQSGRTIALLITANLRRMAQSKLEPPGAGAGTGGDIEARPSRRVNYRAIVRRIRAVPVGSAFEADWAYLQLARRVLPQTYASVIDRWQAWFIHCDPAAEFPQFVKTAHPGRMPEPTPTAVNLGPVPDKHAAARYIELLEDAFDLCRYHHILVQAPRGAACAYKEMGRCPAPCDGTISMDDYRAQIRAAIDFAQTPIDAWRQTQEHEMRRASAALDFEHAALLRQRLDRMAKASKAEFALLDRLENFRFVAVMPSERTSHARLLLIRGGWIAPVIDLPVDAPKSVVVEALDAIAALMNRPEPADLSEAGVENIGLTCWRLFRPKPRGGKKPHGEFIRLRALDAKSLHRALRRLSSADANGQITEQALET